MPFIPALSGSTCCPTGQFLVMPSEKFKGKQRAVDSESEAGPSQRPLSNSKDLVIRFTEGLPDLTLQVAESDVVRDIKRKVRCRRRRFSHEWQCHCGRRFGMLGHSWRGVV